MSYSCISQSIYLDGTLVASGSGSTLSYSWNTKIKKYKTGTHTIKATAKDAGVIRHSQR